MGIAAIGDEDLNGVDRTTTGIRFRWVSIPGPYDVGHLFLGFQPISTKAHALRRRSFFRL